MEILEILGLIGLVAVFCWVSSHCKKSRHNSHAYWPESDKGNENRQLKDRQIQLDYESRLVDLYYMGYVGLESEEE